MIHVAHMPMALQRAQLSADECGALDIECRVKKAVTPMVGAALGASALAAILATIAIIRAR